MANPLVPIVVNKPVEAFDAPIEVLSIVPESISTFDISTSPEPFGVIAILPFEFVEVIAEPLMFILSIVALVIGELTPSVTPSIVPPSILAVVTVPRFEIVAAAKEIAPEAVRFVEVTEENCPEVWTAPPITVPSIEPPLISAVSATRLSMFAVPSMYKSFHSLDELPRSLALSEDGTRSLAT